MSNNAPQSRNEAILQATLDGTEYTAPPQSRIESLLLQLKAAIEDGGGGGGDTQLAAKVNAIEAQLYSTIADVPTNTDSGSMDLYSKDLNTITTSGFYNAMTCTNAPATYCTLVVIGYYLTGYCTQIAADVTTGTLYTRTETNGTWGSWSAKTNAADLAAVATSGAYSDLTGAPTLADVATSGNYSDLSGAPNLATVATSGSYADLSGKPTIDTEISSSSTNAVQNKAVSAALAEKADGTDVTAEAEARQATDAKHTAALAELIDGGAKNRLSVNSGTTPSGAGHFIQDLAIDIPPGDYVLTMTRNGNTTTSIVIKDADSAELYRVTRGAGVNEIVQDFSIASTGKYISIYVGNSVTVENAMICSKAAYDISNKFVPYRPTWDEMWAAIQGQPASANLMLSRNEPTENTLEVENAGEVET